ncbi:hypothetical protein AZF37_05755 [endosymbiont 'TC1' of Trimyema compressum]|uniref:nicotinate-nucleotide adenylyltransferase n=1 Tax=endosymbiont 'TC1' of Trimyema compressum TaxID=243899 RepID=UPI0007F054AF|nr:nicotinate-nucleotide adenylyltransferase [endosymbiont 'TC1' of Trimyema compressum]AMP20745.1 hypothetical protein AZF37_05755 [endosymbiont 'TC1' of Trimyema compressum]
MKKVGILGGTFNPIHRGHVALGEAALKVFDLDKVFFIPAGEPYHKKDGNTVRGEERLKLVSLALENAPKLIPLGIDVERKGPTYTIDTINELKIMEPDSQFYIILGSDAFKYIEQWNDIEALAEKVFFIVAVRACEDEIAWRSFVKTMPEYISNKTLIMPLKPYFISSTDIRYKGIRKSKRKLDKRVYNYILAKGLYK